MTKKDKLTVCRVAASEGFDYAFTDYSSFDEIDDQQFHQLRQAYLDAARCFKDYIGFDEYDECEDGDED